MCKIKAILATISIVVILAVASIVTILSIQSDAEQCNSIESKQCSVFKH